VPIDAFIFGGRRSTTVAARDRSSKTGPKASTWARDHGLRDGRLAAAGVQGLWCVRDPFAMLALHRATNMSDYFPALAGPLGSKLQNAGSKAAEDFSCVNWFPARGLDGKFVWAGLRARNMRVLKWDESAG